ncbi:MAG: response regulator [Planctomycetota bacterium]
METGTTSILIVDDEPVICSLIQDALGESGLECITVSSPQEARELLTNGRFRVLVADIAMPELSGLDLLEFIRQSSSDCRVILITGAGNTQNLATAINLGAYDYFPKPFKMDQLIESINAAASGEPNSPRLPVKAAEAVQLAQQLKEVSIETIRAFVQVVEAKDPHTRRHSEQVTHYATHLARAIGRSCEDIESIRIASLLHDIGKIGIPDSVLVKPGPLNEKEFEMVRRHPALGADILENISIFAREAKLVRYHHENWDGSGYPSGLVGEEIPFDSRIINIADSIDAMLMMRTYKEAYSIDQMLSELERCAGGQFAPDLAAAAIEWVECNHEKIILPDSICSIPQQ